MSFSSGNDPLNNAINAAIQVGLARVVEINTGFESNQPYTTGKLRESVEEIFVVESPTTKTQYGVVLLPKTLTENLVHAIQVAMNGQMLDEKNYRKITLSRTATGNIHLQVGWRV